MQGYVYLVAVALVALAAPGCGLIRIGQDACDHTPGLCGPGGSSSGMAACLASGTSFWECNVVDGPNTVPIPVSHNHLGMCGSFYCASSLADAQNQSGAAGDPSLACFPVSADFTVPRWEG
jgi:hypothetical protein